MLVPRPLQGGEERRSPFRYVCVLLPEQCYLAWRDLKLFALEGLQHERTVKSSAVDIPLVAVGFDLVEEPEALDLVRRLVAFSCAAFIYRRLMDLAVVAADLAHIEYLFGRLSVRVAAYASGIDGMRLFELRHIAAI